MTKGKRPDPLWLRAIREPKAKAWLKKHTNEFPTESFLPDRTAFKDKIVMAREKVAAVIADGMPYEEADQQTLAELVLLHTPRIIAKKLRLTRREVYLRIRALKRAAVRKWHTKRNEAVLARGRKTPSIYEAPEGIAIQTIKFTLDEHERFAYQVQFKRDRVWLDEKGVRFTDDVQEILNNLGVYEIEFETLTVYHHG